MDYIYENEVNKHWTFKCCTCFKTFALKEILLTLAAVVLRIFSNPVANVFQKQLTNSGNPPLYVNFITYFLLSLVCVMAGWNIPWHELPRGFWLYSVLGGIAGGIGNGFLVKALQGGELSVLGPVNAYKSVVGVIVAIFLLGEWPQLAGITGILLILYGSYFVLDTTEEKFTFALLKRKDIQYRIYAMVLTAIEAVFIKKVILFSSAWLSFISWCWFGALISFIVLLLDKKGRSLPRKPFGSQVIKYLSLAFCIGIMQVTTVYTFEHMPVGYALSLFQLSTIVSVLLGYRIFREKEIRKKLAGSALMIAGSCLIILL
jgi:drug/metabolite transporter (DMT)-like permease